MATASAVGSRRSRAASSTCRARRWTSSDGISIRTGQTSKQAPHSDEAYGRDALSSIPVSCGDSTAPIGPG